MNGWLVLGYTGQVVFGSRFFVQWISSEKKRESHIPVVFWYLSIAGGMMLLAYALYRKDPVFILGQSCGLFVYLRNLILIFQKESREKKESK